MRIIMGLYFAGKIKYLQYLILAVNTCAAETSVFIRGSLFDNNKKSFRPQTRDHKFMDGAINITKLR